MSSSRSPGALSTRLRLTHTIMSSDALVLFRQIASLVFTLDGAKSALFYYVLLVQIVKAHRHLRARGARSTMKEVYTWVSKVCSFKILYMAKVNDLAGVCSDSYKCF